MEKLGHMDRYDAKAEMNKIAWGEKDLEVDGRKLHSLSDS